MLESTTIHVDKENMNSSSQVVKKYVPPHLRGKVLQEKPQNQPLAPTFKKTTYSHTPKKLLKPSIADRFATPKTGKSKLSTPKSEEDDDHDHTKDTPDNSGPFIEDQEVFELLQHSIQTNGQSAQSSLSKFETFEGSKLNLEAHISLIEGITEYQSSKKILIDSSKNTKPLIPPKPWMDRLSRLAKLCRFESPADSVTAAELIGYILVFHTKYILREQWKYDRRINKVAKIMISFLSEIAEKNLSGVWNRELMSKIMIARLVYSRQLGNKWIRRMWRTTQCSMDDILLVDQPRNTVYSLFNCKTKKLYINCVKGGSMIDALEWISAQTQERIRSGIAYNLSTFSTPSKSPQSSIGGSSSIKKSPLVERIVQPSPVNEFKIYSDDDSLLKSPPRSMDSPASLKSFASPSSTRSEQTPLTDPFGYIAHVGLQNWMIFPLDTLDQEESAYIEHRTKQRVHECRHRIIDNTIFFRKIKKPPKKMSDKRYKRFLELRDRQKKKRREKFTDTEDNTTEKAEDNTTEKATVNTSSMLQTEKPLSIDIPVDHTIDGHPIKKPLSTLCSTPSGKENTPTTPLSIRSKQTPGRSALGNLSPAILNKKTF